MKPGQNLAHYRLAERIGKGGMGEVWRAVDTRLDREIALKLLPAETARDPERLKRFQREARAVAALTHPNIVTIHSVEEADTPTGSVHFITMELIQGSSLGELIDEGGLAVERLVELAVPLCEAVAVAHRRHITHRDLKPDNIMVDEEGRLRVLDFGLAKFDTQTTGDETALTQEGRIMGTAAYMSPEQVQGKAVDARSDVFSLGIILYEMATGRKPFSGDSSAEIIAAILRDDPPAVTELRPELPSQVSRMIRQAIEKAPQRRFQTALDLKNELEKLRDEMRRDTLPAVGAAKPSPLSNLRAIAVLPLDDLSGDPTQAWFADGLTDAMINSLGRIGALKVISRTSIMRYKGVNRSLPEIARELGVDAIVEGSVLRAGERVRITAQLIEADGDQLIWGDSYEHDLGDVLSLQSHVARTIAEKIQVELTPQEEAHLTRAAPVDPAVHEACLKGRHFWYKRTNESVRKGLKCFEEAVRLEPRYAPAYAGIADSYIVDGGRYVGVTPQVAYGRAREAALKAVELDDDFAEAHTSLAAVMTDYDWDWIGADREYRRAIELNPNYVTAHSWYAEQLSRMGRHSEAVREAELARELDPNSLVSSMIVAWILYFARRYDEAVEWAQRTLERDPDYATALRILGWAHEELGRYGQAIVNHERASELTDRQPNFVGQLGRAYAVAGQTDRAREILDELLALSETTYVSSLDIAIIHATLDDRQAALDWLEKAHDERADHLPYLKVNPRLDPLRSEPRYQELLQRMGLSDNTLPTTL